MSNPFWHPNSRYNVFAFGIILLFVAVVYTCMGKTWDRRYGWVSRANNPKRFWLDVGTLYLAGVVLIGLAFLESGHAI
jgi:hypothetical protein